MLGKHYLLIDLLFWEALGGLVHTTKEAQMLFSYCYIVQAWQKSFVTKYVMQCIKCEPSQWSGFFLLSTMVKESKT